MDHVFETMEMIVDVVAGGINNAPMMKFQKGINS